ncbi:hypothetical protein GCM10010521_19330 [Streptomyces rameus]|uniref:Uncharacterized protein n=1 Tax=Streptomyces rameus TaxID=68261 RepID=A0ABP6N1V1_9ACTN
MTARAGDGGGRRGPATAGAGRRTQARGPLMGRAAPGYPVASEHEDVTDAGVDEGTAEDDE